MKFGKKLTAEARALKTNDRTKAGFVEGTIALITNTALFSLKIWASIVTGSIALAADAWHTLSDSLSAVVVIAGSKFGSKKADREHPFGHGRWELIASLFVAVIIGIIAFDFLKSSVEQLNNHEQVEFGLIAIIATAVSIVVKELMAQYAFYIARKTGNISVKANGWHHRSDALSSVVVLIGIFFAKQFWWIDSILGIIIALMLFYVCFSIMKEAITKILGEEPSQELINNITGEVKAMFGEELYLHHFHLHNYVSHNEVTLHIRLNEKLSIGEGHSIAFDIENMIKEKFKMEATIHVEPLADNTKKKN
ncbi:MAG: cation diffusion facilitator family transporter [Treponema sp.]|nr:cation diffusion facilitator family transporter [Treponema sp.]